MNELIKRSLFGLIYAAIVLLSLQSHLWTTILFGVFLAIGLKEFSYLLKLPYKTVWLPSFFIFFTSFLYNLKEPVNVKVLYIAGGFALIALFIPMIYFIFDKISREMLSNIYLAIFYLVLPFSLALGLNKKLLPVIFIIIWASDSFAYLFGKYFGKHKLAEKISPKKTIEGFVGGLAGSLITALLIYYSNWPIEMKLIEFLILSIIIVIFGTFGDLLESRFKRLAGVKDSGNMIPGHGGILDRLDSFILAVPFVFAYLLII